MSKEEVMRRGDITRGKRRLRELLQMDRFMMLGGKN